jgi:hypothetical protein
MIRKSKDVTPHENASPERKVKKSADSLPKILDMACYNGSLQQQWVKCGKANCKCSRGQLHGPYFYLFVSMSDGLWKAYVRRGDVPLIRAAIMERKRLHSSFRAEVRQSHNLLRQMVKAAVGVRR